METLTWGRRVERRVGLGTPKRLRIFATVVVGLMAVMVEASLMLAYARAHTLVADRLQWSAFLVSGLVPIAGLIHAFWRLRRVTLPSHAEELVTRLLSGFATITYVLMFFLLNILSLALDHVR